mgnify:FL=1
MKDSQKLHEAFWWGNVRWAIILAIGVSGVAVAKDYIDKNVITDGSSQLEPNPTNVIGVPESTLDAPKDLKIPTLPVTEVPPTPKPLPSMTFTLPPTETPTSTATVTETAATILTPSGYALKAAGELGEGAKAIRLLVSSFEGKKF